LSEAAIRRARDAPHKDAKQRDHGAMRRDLRFLHAQLLELQRIGSDLPSQTLLIRSGKR